MAANRRTLGQWFTPPAVVDLALGLARTVGIRSSPRVLDPTCGDGAFLLGVQRNELGASAVVGVELDGETADAARASVASAKVTHGDVFAYVPEGPFDLVIGNPPYVRLERIAQAQRARAQGALSSALGNDSAAEVAALCARGDIAGPCLVYALSMLQPGGVLSMVVSTALLDADYAAVLWRLVERIGTVRMIVAAPTERWFEDAAVNAMVVVVERREQGDDDCRPPVEIGRLVVPTFAAARDCGDGLAAVARIRQGMPGDPKGWAELLRADDGWLTLLESARPRLVTLGSCASLWRGSTTGANPFFYLRRDERLDLEPEVCVPLLRSPRDRGGAWMAVAAKATGWVALKGPTDPTAMAGVPRFAARVEQFADLASRPSLAARSPWWALSSSPARLFLPKAYSSRFFAVYTDEMVVADQRLYAIEPHGAELIVVAATLNSVFTALAIESTGRASMGLGALELSVADAAGLMVLDPRAVDDTAARAITTAFVRRAKRAVAKLEDEYACADRRAMDLAIASAHGLGSDAVEGAWHALLRANRERHDRIGRIAQAGPE